MFSLTLLGSLACVAPNGLPKTPSDAASGDDSGTSVDDSGSAAPWTLPDHGPHPCEEAWCEGQPIPGWDDLPTAWTPPAGATLVELGGWVLFAYGGGFLPATADDPRLGTGLSGWGMNLYFGDCLGYPCQDSDDPHSTFQWRLFLGSDDDPVRGEGWYLYDSACGADNALNTDIDFFPTVEQGNRMLSCVPTAVSDSIGAAGTYLSYVGPDRISGFAYFDVPEGWESPSGEVVYYMTFEVHFRHHNVSPRFPYTYYVYDGLAPSYDAAWPWDQITDPAIRDLVYEWYKPE